MGLNLFLLILSVLMLFFLKINPDIKEIKKANVNKPNVVFFNSIMYDINDNEVNKIIQSKEANLYNNKNELYDATIILKSKQNIDTISAEYIVKKGFIYKFYNNVFLDKSDGLQLSTNFLIFDDLNKIIKNDTEFVINYKNNILNGTHLFYDVKREYFKAEQTQFKLKVDL